MKRIICVCLMLWMMLTWGGAEMEATVQVDITPELWKSLSIISYQELRLYPSGYCDGGAYELFYAVDDGYQYCICENDRIISWHTLDHPYIKKNGAAVQQVIAQDNQFYLSVLDHEIGKSYLAVQIPGEAEPTYGEILDIEIKKMAMGMDACYAVATANGKPVIVCLSKTGKLLWRKDVESSAYAFQTCWMSENVLYTVGSANGSGRICISAWDQQGNLMQMEEFVFENAPYQQQGARYDIYQAMMTDDEIILAGQLLYKTGDACAFCARFRHDMQLVEARFYEKWGRIQSFVFDRDEMLMLTYPCEGEELSGYFHCLLSYDEKIMIPLERKQHGTNTLMMGMNAENQIYLFGRSWPEGCLHMDSAFVGLLDWKNFFLEPDSSIKWNGE